MLLRCALSTGSETLLGELPNWPKPNTQTTHNEKAEGNLSVNHDGEPGEWSNQTTSDYASSRRGTYPSVKVMALGAKSHWFTAIDF